MADPHEEQVRNYFLPKLGVSKETKDLIRGIAVRLSAFESGTKEEKQDEDLKLEAFRLEISNKLFRKILPDKKNAIISFISFDNSDRTFNFFSHDDSIPHIAIGLSTPNKESLYPYITEFFSRYSFFLFMGEQHAILFKKSKEQPFEGYKLVDTLDSNGDIIAKSIAFTKLQPEDFSFFLHLTDEYGKIMFNHETTCPNIQHVFPTCAFWSLISFLYFDLDFTEIIAKIQRLLEENGLPNDSKRFINAGLLAIFQKLLDTGRFLTAEEVEPGHRERGLGKCRKGGAGNKKAIQNKYNEIKIFFEYPSIKKLTNTEKQALETLKNQAIRELDELGIANPRHHLFFKGPLNVELNKKK